MRLHSLEITAFGPFAETVEVDFDTLSGAGVFLLTGPTGAGKSSVLDAVCFALYGDVPGDRSTAKRLRSDHAPAGAAPRVRLECTLAGRRFQITRSPSWERPKKRGTGTTHQQASVSLSERVAGDWQPVTTRLDEAGHLVAHLLGMNLIQFTQVALLPQGRFQSFLRARSEDRHRLLQQLFRTGRFEAVETWLRQRKSDLAAAAREQQRVLAEVASRTSEIAGEPLPGSCLVGSDDEHSATALGDWAGEVTERHRATLAEDSERLGAARLAAQEALRAADDGRVLAEQQERRRAAEDERAVLVARVDQVTALRAAVVSARRAAAVVPLERARAGAESVRSETAQRLAQLAEAVDRSGLTELTEVTEAAVAARLAALTRDLTATELLVPEQRRLERLLTQAAQLDEERAGLEAELTTLDAALDQAPQRLAALDQQRGEAQHDEAALQALAVTVAALRDREGAARALVLLREGHQQADALRLAAVDAAQGAREHWLQLQEQRITGMAAELAGRLAVGDSCPVCGSAEHPTPAQPQPGAPDEESESGARRRLDDAETHRHAHEEAVRDLQTQIAIAEQAAAGQSVAEAATELATLAVREAALRESAARLPQLRREAADVGTAVDADTRRREELRLARQHVATGLAGLIHQADEISDQIATSLGGGPDSSLDGRRRRLARGVAHLGDLAAAVRAAGEAHDAVTRAELAAQDAAVFAGFGGVRDMLSAALPAAELEAAEAALLAHDAGLAACDRLLADPCLSAAVTLPVPDLAALTTAAELTSARLLDAESSARAGAVRLKRLTELTGDLQEALHAAAPLREELSLVTRLSLFVDGRSPDNRLSMRLSAYVLAARLAQVVAAANERLATMSDRRYTLEHSGHRGAGETRGGLSLLIRDDWTGETRDPATLSGGETFVVSLALALGLADTVAHEAGGADLDTLFVDEGFGALDADTLDDVLDTLDSLRDGGRVVGVVSHVPQMRERIPTHLDVRKGRGGSHLALSHG